MSDTEDWFEKDIEDFAKDVKTIKKANGLKDDDSTETPASDAHDEFTLTSFPVQFLEDIGGSYGRRSKNQVNNNCGKKLQNTTKQDSERFIQTIPFQTLKTISEYESLEIFQELSIQSAEFFQTLSAGFNTPDRTLQVIIEILAKLCTLPLPEIRKHIITKSWMQTDYWLALLNYIKRLSQHKNLLSAKKILSESNLTDLMTSILVFSTFYIGNLHYDRCFVEFLKRLLDNYCAGSENQRLTKIGMELEHLILKANDNIDQTFYNEIYPTIDDLKVGDNNRIDLKPNLVKGRYPDVRLYIEIQLALLKEDFVSPLRDGIKEFIKGSNKLIANLRVYEEVKFKVMQKSKCRKYQNLLIDLNVSHNQLKKHDLHSSKRFMFGSLVCFTKNRNVDDLILGIVTNCDTEILKNGMIQIDILKMYNHEGDLFSQTFIMLESEIYFEPYHQVYNALKNLNEYNFPLKKYIIDCDTRTELPDYIPKEGKVYYTHRQTVFDVKDPTTWPTPKSIQLHESQFRAFQDALTRKFGIIQGPPGTGKTYIGLQIVSALLENTKLQILIICLTNHALDQFLMGILNYTEDIVRMGFMSKTQQLDRFNVKMLNENNLELIDKRVRVSYYHTKKEHTDLLIEFEVLHNQLGSSDLTDEMQLKINEEILVLQDKIRSVSKRLDDLKQITDFNLIKDKRVVGMTTTYAARCWSLLKMMRAPIVVIEETGEVLESHIIAALTEDTQHVIMIGDHQQLRPATSVYQLAVEFKMNISLIERMIINGLRCSMLKIQHRQRPEFANLIRPHIYQELYDSESVSKYPDVKGVAKNLFFINHSNLENRKDDETTITNHFEAKFLIYFCNYLIMQGYLPSEITILTVYNGQMQKLQALRRKFNNLAQVRISVVDNFQGEENKIILLSLVRSNSDNVIGYLGIKNRACVALSRAREGFYIVGNMKLLRDASSTWKPIEQELIKQNAIDNCIPLQCQTHGTITSVSQPLEFSKFTYGGCLSVCGELFDGNQKCDSVCHTNLYKHYVKECGSTQ